MAFTKWFSMLLWFTLFGLQAARLKAEEEPVEVNTKIGKIVGRTCKGSYVNEFLGIPYAKPPIGKLRFKKPQPIEPLADVLYANKQPPACLQYSEEPNLGYDREPGKSEDCLYLNIWVPCQGKCQEKKAVLFWIHGGGFIMTSIRMDLFQGHVLSRIGDVIVVTTNYRLGAFGFLYSGSEDAPGNMGIWDILTSLQWVNDNIEDFGGDPNRITIAGESAGSVVAGMFSVIPLAEGLFSRQILQSGSPAYTTADNNTKNFVLSQLLAEEAGCADDTATLRTDPSLVVKCLQEIDGMELKKIEAGILSRTGQKLIPQYGDELVPLNPREALISGKFKPNDLLFGVNKDEGSPKLTAKYPELFGFFGEKDPKINKTLGTDMILDIFKSYPEPLSVVDYYLGDLSENDFDKVRYQVYTSLGDYTLFCPTVYFAEKFADTGNNVFAYFWSHRPSNLPYSPWTGAIHFSEVPFIFGLPLRKDDFMQGEINLSCNLMKIWAEFIKHGRPNQDWPLYSKPHPAFLYVNLSALGKEGLGLHQNNCDFFRKHFGFVYS